MLGGVRADSIAAMDVQTDDSEQPIAITLRSHTPSPHLVDLRPTTVVLRPSKKTTSRGVRQEDLREYHHLAPDRSRRARYDELLVVSFFEVVGMLIYHAASAVVRIFTSLATRFEHFFGNLHDRWLGEVQEIGLRRRAQPRRMVTVPVLAPPPRWGRAVAGFALLLVAALLPIAGLSSLASLAGSRAKLVETGKAGQSGLLTAGAKLAQGDFARAQSLFSSSAQSFTTTLETINDVQTRTFHLGSLLPGTRNQIRTVSALATIGNHMAKVGEMITRSFELQVDAGLLARVETMSQAARAAAPFLREASREADRINLEVIPESERASVELLKDAVGEIERSVRALPAIANAASELLGKSSRKRYLVLFQNDAELRPTGGFIGSFAEVTLDRGEIKDIQIPGGGSYDLQGDQRARVQAPEPLRLVSARWHFHDSNWFADFPTAAQKIAWFYEKGNWPTVDGVIAITASGVEDLIRVLGPVPMVAYGRTITAENFKDETQKIVELEYDKTENRPKQFIADLAPVLLERLQSGDPVVLRAALESLGKSLRSKHLLVWSRNPELQSFVVGAGWGGELASTTGDSLLVVDANIAGQKTDAVIKEEVSHEARIQEDGSVIDAVTITRTHRGTRGALFTGVRNVDYLRVYVPLGSVLLAASGDFRPPPQDLFEKPDDSLREDEDLGKITRTLGTDPETGTVVGEESGRTYFGNWLQMDPGERVSVSFTYQLPFRVMVPASRGFFAAIRNAVSGPATAPYTLLVQKQPGTRDRTFSTSLVRPVGTLVRFQYPESTGPVALDHDLFFGTLLSR